MTYDIYPQICVRVFDSFLNHAKMTEKALLPAKSAVRPNRIFSRQNPARFSPISAKADFRPKSLPKLPSDSLRIGSNFDFKPLPLPTLPA
jgi:hypothetical protein